jgi:ketol-acid reductoisomerase
MVTDKEINSEVKKRMNGLTKFQQNKFKQVSETVWFKNYAKNSKEKLSKLIKKIKSGVKHGKYGRDTEQREKVMRGWKKPTPKQAKKEKKQRRKEKETEKKEKDPYAPSGREYSDTENHEGRGSKRARAYRERHNIDAGDWKY